MKENNDQVNFEVVIQPEKGRKSVFDKDSYITVANIDEYKASPSKSILVARKLQKNGIQVFQYICIVYQGEI